MQESNSSPANLENEVKQMQQKDKVKIKKQGVAEPKNGLQLLKKQMLDLQKELIENPVGKEEKKVSNYLERLNSIKNEATLLINSEDCNLFFKLHCEIFPHLLNKNAAQKTIEKHFESMRKTFANCVRKADNLFILKGYLWDLLSFPCFSEKKYQKFFAETYKDMLSQYHSRFAEKNVEPCTFYEMDGKPLQYVIPSMEENFSVISFFHQTIIFYPRKFTRIGENHLKALKDHVSSGDSSYFLSSNDKNENEEAIEKLVQDCFFEMYLKKGNQELQAHLTLAINSAEELQKKISIAEKPQYVLVPILIRVWQAGASFVNKNFELSKKQYAAAKQAIKAAKLRKLDKDILAVLKDCSAVINLNLDSCQFYLDREVRLSEQKLQKAQVGIDEWTQGLISPRNLEKSNNCRKKKVRKYAQRPESPLSLSQETADERQVNMAEQAEQKKSARSHPKKQDIANLKNAKSQCQSEMFALLGVLKTYKGEEEKSSTNYKSRFDLVKKQAKLVEDENCDVFFGLHTGILRYLIDIKSSKKDIVEVLSSLQETFKKYLKHLDLFVLKGALYDLWRYHLLSEKDYGNIFADAYHKMLPLYHETCTKLGTEPCTFFCFQGFIITNPSQQYPSMAVFASDHAFNYPATLKNDEKEKFKQTNDQIIKGEISYFLSSKVPEEKSMEQLLQCCFLDMFTVEKEVFQSNLTLAIELTEKSQKRSGKNEYLIIPLVIRMWQAGASFVAKDFEKSLQQYIEVEKACQKARSGLGNKVDEWLPLIKLNIDSCKFYLGLAESKLKKQEITKNTWTDNLIYTPKKTQSSKKTKTQQSTTKLEPITDDLGRPQSESVSIQSEQKNKQTKPGEKHTSQKKSSAFRSFTTSSAGRMPHLPGEQKENNQSRIVHPPQPPKIIIPKPNSQRHYGENGNKGENDNEHKQKALGHPPYSSNNRNSSLRFFGNSNSPSARPNSKHYQGENGNKHNQRRLRYPSYSGNRQQQYTSNSQSYPYNRQPSQNQLRRPSNREESESTNPSAISTTTPTRQMQLPSGSDWNRPPSFLGKSTSPSALPNARPSETNSQLRKLQVFDQNIPTQQSAFAPPLTNLTVPTNQTVQDPESPKNIRQISEAKQKVQPPLTNSSTNELATPNYLNTSNLTESASLAPPPQEQDQEEAQSMLRNTSYPSLVLSNEDGDQEDGGCGDGDENENGEIKQGEFQYRQPPQEFISRGSAAPVFLVAVPAYINRGRVLWSLQSLPGQVIVHQPNPLHRSHPGQVTVYQENSSQTFFYHSPESGEYYPDATPEPDGYYPDTTADSNNYNSPTNGSY